MLVRLIVNTVKAVLLAALVFLAYVALAPSQSEPERFEYATPGPTPTLPACVTEDGAGQALCLWDAQHMGNGVGTSVISGDCALVTQANRMQALCVQMHTTQKGTIIAQECNDMMPFESVKESDWEWLDRCYKNRK
jgi:hypothetical protein